MRQSDIIIEARNLRKSFGDVQAVCGIDLDVKRGEMYGLVGPDGAGKSSLIRMLCGLERLDGGNGIILGFEFPAQIEMIKRRIGYLSQRFSLYIDLTVQENIQFFAEIHGVENYRERLEFLLEVTNLSKFRNRLADHLSGGMKQKLALACTLIHKPDLVYLDEPTVGVDPVSRRDFWSILSDLVGDELTVVIATPYLDEAERCSRLSLLHKGRVLLEGKPEDIRGRMEGDLVEIVCTDGRKAMQILSDQDNVRETQLFGDRVNALVGSWETENEAILSRLRSGGIEVMSSRRVPPSIENVFVSMLRSDARVGL